MFSNMSSCCSEFDVSILRFSFCFTSIIWMNDSQTCQYSVVICSPASRACTARRSSLNYMFIFLMPLMELAFCQTTSRLAFFWSREAECPDTRLSASSSLPNLPSMAASGAYFMYCVPDLDGSNAMPVAGSVASSSSLKSA